MSAIEMSSGVKFPYQKLKQEDDIDDYQLREYYKKALARSRTWYRFRKVPIRRRFKLKIPSLRRFIRRKAKLVSSIRVSFANVVKRLKESQSHLGDLFAGNYLFLQVTPTSFKCLDKGHHHLNGLSSRYSLQKIAY
ncbi:hypothetical protein TIFTF001_011824 [Ficus carica]|uniref:Uncharacterized protein n=1 Tax=Ficus carica TaxID=3494 RepID=A0AA88D4M8_FICCA|nr:hypothetical protein TIFTF001_011824 [Ficus carica]